MMWIKENNFPESWSWSWSWWGLPLSCALCPTGDVQLFKTYTYARCQSGKTSPAVQDRGRLRTSCRVGNRTATRTKSCRGAFRSQRLSPHLVKFVVLASMCVCVCLWSGRRSPSRKTSLLLAKAWVVVFFFSLSIAAMPCLWSRLVSC